MSKQEPHRCKAAIIYCTLLECGLSLPLSDSLLFFTPPRKASFKASYNPQQGIPRSLSELVVDVVDQLRPASRRASSLPCLTVPPRLLAQCI